MKFPKVLQIASKLQNKKFEVKSKLLMPFTAKKGDATLYLLKFNGKTQKYDILGVFPAFGVDFDNYRQQPKFNLSSVEKVFGKNKNESLSDVIYKATHFSYSPEFHLFTIDNGDTTAIQQTKFGYTVFGVMTGKQDRFDPTEND